MPLRTRLTERFGLSHPVISAPMGTIAGGRLAAAVSNAGGLGLIGGGYGDADWLEREFAAAGNTPVGCGFITWSLAKNPDLLDLVLAKRPTAIMLSFGQIEPFAARVKQSGIPLICQVQSMRHAREAVSAGADLIVAQGQEAGGHSGNRSTFTLVAEVADYIANAKPDTVLAAAGGVADGRSLAAALMLGADGVLIGTRLVASEESLATDGFRSAITSADGDATMKTTVVDLVRGYHWPDDIKVRVLKNKFVATWHGRENALADPQTNTAERERYWTAFRAGDTENSAALMGEAAGLVRDIKPAAQILDDMVDQASRLLANAARFVV